MKTSPTNSLAGRPDGRVNKDQRGYPSGPQGPSGAPREGQPLRTPADKKSMKATRTRIVKFRLTPDEMKELVLPLEINKGKMRGLSRLVRARLFSPRRQAAHLAESKHYRLLTSAVNNLNVIARRTLDLAKPEAAAQVIGHLVSLERVIRDAFDRPPRP